MLTTPYMAAFPVAQKSPGLNDPGFSIVYVQLLLHRIDAYALAVTAHALKTDFAVDESE